MENNLTKRGFYKVKQSGGSYIVAYFFNPATKETISTCVRDYDYFDCSRDNDELYYMPIDQAAAELYRKHIGIIAAGDTVRVVKGRKVPIGTVARVARVFDYRDCYGRTVATYAVFDDGRKTSVSNCEIVD